MWSNPNRGGGKDRRPGLRTPCLRRRRANSPRRFGERQAESLGEWTERSRWRLWMRHTRPHSHARNARWLSRISIRTKESGGSNGHGGGGRPNENVEYRG